MSAKKRTAVTAAGGGGAEVERQWEELLDSVADGVIVLDPGRLVVRANRRAADMIGLTAPDEAYGKPIDSFVVPADRGAVVGTFDRVIADGGTVVGEYSAARVDGTEIAVEACGRKVSFGGGDAVVVTVRDVTERRRSAARLSETERTLQTLMSNLPGMAYRCRNDESWTMDFVSQGCFSLTGYYSSDLIGNKTVSFAEIIHPEDRGTVSAAVAEAVANDAPFHLQYRIVTASGDVRWVSERGQAVRGAADPREFLEGFIIDVTDRHRAEEELERRERLYRELWDGAPVAYHTRSGGDVLTRVNRTCRRLLGYAREEMLGRPFVDFVDPDHRETARRRLEEVLASGAGAGPCELVCVRKDGSRVHVVVEDSADVAPDGTVAGVRTTMTDITEQKRVRGRLEETIKRVEETMEGTIEAMSRIVETKDPYTAGHEKRVADLACAIGRRIGIPEETVRGLQMASVIHDIGKIYVPAEILSKPCRLTEIEFSMVKTHAQFGYRTIERIQFPWPIGNAILQHHERMNGSGYPAGLKGEAIIIEARILAVADVVESMASHRPYRPALGIEAALEEIVSKKGVLYDPEVVEACVTLFADGTFSFP